MAIQKVEFEFPDPDKVADKTDFVERDDGSFVLKVEGRPADEEAKRERAKAKAKDDDKTVTSELIVKTVCQHFVISRSSLLKSQKVSGETYTALIFLVNLLKKYSMTSQKEISIFIGKSPAMINKYISDFNTMQMTLTKIDKSNLMMYQNLDEKINNYLNK